MYLHGAETERLRFRKLELSDIADWKNFFKNNPNIKYLGLDEFPDIDAQSKDWIERQLLRYESKRYGHHALIDKQTNSLIGQCGLLAQDIEGIQEIEVGYHILPEYWGKGYATEAAEKCKNYAIENKICNSLISVIDIRNTASQNVANKLGMRIDKGLKLFGLDVYLYRLKI